MMRDMMVLDFGFWSNDFSRRQIILHREPDGTDSLPTRHARPIHQPISKIPFYQNPNIAYNSAR